ncbi:MAG: tetratricopeptide repeat protein [Nitrospiraceae bacterium]
MLSDWTRIDLATRLGGMNRTLDRLVGNESSRTLQEALDAAMGRIVLGDTNQAAAVLEAAVQANPSWLRGYLLLATIYEYEHKADLAATYIEQGLAVCARSSSTLRLQRWGERVGSITGPLARDRIIQNAQRLTRYERIFKQRLAMIQIRRGCWDEAFAQWEAIEGEHDA